MKNEFNKQAKLVNLTPHTITDVTTGTVIPASGIVARAKTVTVKVGNIGICPVYTTEMGETVLPPKEEGIVYIVAALALKGAPLDRDDLVAPGNAQRNKETGTIMGCVGFRIREKETKTVQSEA